MKSITVIYKQEGLKPQTIIYAVNDANNGLWKNGQQIVGTCDFHAKSPAELIRKLRADSMKGMESYKMVRGSAGSWE